MYFHMSMVIRGNLNIILIKFILIINDEKKNLKYLKQCHS